MLSTTTTLKAETPENEDSKRDMRESKLYGKEKTQQFSCLKFPFTDLPGNQTV